MSDQLTLLDRQLAARSEESDSDRELQLLTLALSQGRLDRQDKFDQDQLGETRRQFNAGLSRQDEQNRIAQQGVDRNFELAQSRNRLDDRRFELLAGQAEKEDKLTRLALGQQQMSNDLTKAFAVAGQAGTLAGGAAQSVIGDFQSDLKTRLSTTFGVPVDRISAISARVAGDDDVGSALSQIDTQLGSFERAVRSGLEKEDGPIVERLAPLVAIIENMPQIMVSLNDLKDKASSADRKKIDAMQQRLFDLSDIGIQGRGVIAAFDASLGEFVDDDTRRIAELNIARTSDIAQTFSSAQGGALNNALGTPTEGPPVDTSPGRFAEPFPSATREGLTTQLRGDLSDLLNNIDTGEPLGSGTPIPNAGRPEGVDRFTEPGGGGLARLIGDLAGDIPGALGSAATGARDATETLSNVLIGVPPTQTRSEIVGRRDQAVASMNAQGGGETVNAINPQGNVIPLRRSSLTPERIQELLDAGFRFPGLNGG